MQFEIKFGSVSWINPMPNPIWLAAKAQVLNPSWIPKTYIGLVATANEQPPAQIDDFAGWQEAKQFRGLTYGHLGVVIDDQTQTVTKVQQIKLVTNPGWTPPFSLLRYPTAGIGSIFDGWTAMKGAWSFSYHEGEQSPLSDVVVGARHKNSVLKTSGVGESVLANALLKFRAGAITDNLGIVAVGALFHVPWVWCETLITWANGRVKMYGQGSIFPTHNWYLDGRQVGSVAQVSDSSFPKKPMFNVPGQVRAMSSAMNALGSIDSVLDIDPNRLALWPVLSAGAPAAGPQTPLGAEAGLGGLVTSHGYTAGPGAMVKYP